MGTKFGEDLERFQYISDACDVMQLYEQSPFEHEADQEDSSLDERSSDDLRSPYSHKSLKIQFV